MTRFRWIVFGGLVGFLLAAGYLRFQLRNEYRSVGRIRINTAALAQQYIPGIGTATEQSLIIRQIRTATLSAPTLQNVISTNGLYPGVQTAAFRKNLEISVSHDQIEVACTYSNPVLAQQITKDILGRLQSAYFSASLLQQDASEHFLRTRYEQVSALWTDAQQTLQNSPGTSKSVLQLEVELAREDYKQTQIQLAEVHAANMVLTRKQGPTLEIIDPASLPTAPITDKRRIMFGGSMAGC